ncbi:MAG: CIA30 family protein [Lachnospiraceae bacterium]|nr:CIA30 family protein [Lachnospiraceae bacterium]
MFKMKQKVTAMTMAVAMASTVVCGVTSLTPVMYAVAAPADDATHEKADAESDFVEIAVTPDVDEKAADFSKTPEKITLSDAEATDSAKALYTYFVALTESDQVLFGHQNDVSRHVGQNELGDVYDVTGSVSGVFGIDSLALCGSEAGGTDAKTALENSVNYSKTAAREGAIVTLSTHMPNFTNSKIVKNDDGSFDFFACDFNESKDTSNDSATKILPGGEYNDAFNAYLDIIADYALQLQEENIPVVFRPFHENTGSWFWWGSTNAIETYKSLYRYTRDYLEAKGVHNMLYVYSPNGPLTSEDEYLSRYPGDEYVDILAFDYYDDYNEYPATSDGSFFTNLEATCQVVASVAEQKGKIAAISETGVRVMKKDGSDNEGLLVKGNPVREEATGTNWYSKVSEIAKENNMPYYLVWANFSDTNFYVPYKYDETTGQEMINEFIEYYNEDSSIFGAQTNFYENMDSLTSGTEVVVDEDAAGYMVYPFELATVLEPTTLQAAAKNVGNVQFVVAANDVSVTLDAKKAADSTLYTAELTQEAMDEVGKVDVATITLVADGTELAKIGNISLGKEKEQAAANVFDDFESYSGNNGLLDSAYTMNSAAGCSAEFLLDETNKADGTYGGGFHYMLTTTGQEVWAGRVNSELNGNDFSGYNAIQLWVKTDGQAQKVVVQVADDSGEEFEVYLTDLATEVQEKWITIPFDSFKGKQNGTLNTSDITKFAVWCNSIIPEGHEGDWTVDSTIYYDAIEAVNISEEDLAKVDANGLIVTDEPLATVESSQEEMVEVTEEATAEVTDNDATDTNTDETTKAGKGSTVITIIVAIVLVVIISRSSLFTKKKK